MNIFDPIAKHNHRSHAIRGGIMAGIALNAGDLDVTSKHTLKQSMQLIGAGSSGVRALGNSIRSINHSLDDRLDTMQVEHLLAAGDATLGTTPSAFIRNPEIVTPEDWATLRTLVDNKLLTTGELHSFGNIMGQKIKQGAKASLAYRNDPTHEHRMQVAEANLQLNETLFGMMLHMFSKRPELAAAVENGLSLESLRQVYPKSTNAARLVQMIDDQSDLLPDLVEEHRTGRVSPNSILARASRSGELTDSAGKLQPALVSASSDLIATYPQVPVDLLPRVLHDSIREAGQELRERSAEHGWVARNLIRAYWDAGMKNGLESDHRDEAISGRSRF